LTFSYYLNKR